MSELSKASYKALYGSSGTQFPNNTTGLITEPIMRTFGENQADSFLFRPDAQNPAYLNATASGTDTYTATISPAITAYADGQRFYIKFTNANTGAATINLNTLGAIAIRKNGATALAAGDIGAGQIYLIGYDGTNFQILGKFSSSTLGGSTGSIDNAILRADGTGGATLQSSVVTIDDTGNAILGQSGTSGIDRSITAEGSSANVSINLIAKGVGTANITSGSSSIQASNNSGNTMGVTSGTANNMLLCQSSATNTVNVAGQVNHFSSGTPAAGFGTSFQFLLQNDQGAAIEAVYTDATNASEDVDLILKTMAAGATAAERVRINNNGVIVTGKLYLAALNTAPSSASDTGTAGEIRIDANHIYFCVATNTWKRVAIATW